MNTLFLSASTGGGHDKAAAAIMDCLRQRDPHGSLLLCDSLKSISPTFDKFITGTYLRTLRNTPKLYGSFYRLSEKTERVTDVTKTLNQMFSYRLSEYINRLSPSVIVSTHTFPLQMVSHLKKKGRLRMPAVGIVTDYTNHFFWKLDQIDAFIVAHDSIKASMVDMGIPKERIYPFGIPVGSCFLRRRERCMLQQAMGLEEKETVLVMGGSLGFGEIEKVFTALLQCRRNIQILVVAGLNQKLELQLKKISRNGGSGKTVRIFGYTDRIPELMDLSDLIITKPGGVSVAEALVKQLPVVLMSPLPGQEERNARFLTHAGAAIQIRPGDSMDDLLHQLLDNPQKLQHMKRIAASLARPDAAEKTALLLEKLSGAPVQGAFSGNLAAFIPQSIPH